MKRAALTIAAVLAAWTLTAATVRTATETFVTNRIAIALQSATDYTDSAIVFEAGAATNYTDSTASTLRDSIAGKADATNTYTKAETDAKIVELAPAPGNYAAVSNAAMAAKATLEGVFDPEQPTFVPYAVRAENADYASFASDAGRADEAQNAASLDGRDGDGIIAQLNAATKTNALQQAALAGKQDTLPFPTNEIPYAAITGTPTNVSAFVNDAGYLTGYTETDPTVSAWAKAASKPTYAYSEITNKPTFATVATSGSYNDLADKPTIPSPTAPVASATLAWQSNGSAIVVSVGAAGTLAATLTGWIEGQTQTALITIAAGASVSSEVKLVGYGTWPSGGQFLASATRVGNNVYVTPIVLVN